MVFKGVNFDRFRGVRAVTPIRCENLPPGFQKSGKLVLLQRTQCLGLLKNDNDMASYMVICHR